MKTIIEVKDIEIYDLFFPYLFVIGTKDLKVHLTIYPFAIRDNNQLKESFGNHLFKLF